MGNYLKILEAGDGDVLLLLGNEAIARGIIEAGVGYAATYPGTPSSEIGDVLFDVASKAGIHFEFSTNEKVALEGAYAASVSGVRSVVFMKHVGLNVASDSLITSAYTGVRAGFVVITADDPSMFSSQNEQDNRKYAELAHLPMVEPSNPQEGKYFLLRAFELSEKYSIPVLFRTTTRVAHQRAAVTCGARKKPDTKGRFTRDIDRFVSLPANAISLKKDLLNKLVRISGDSEFYNLNTVIGSGSALGIISSGEGFNVVMDAISLNDMQADVLKLGLTSPIPEQEVLNFIAAHESIIIVEELDPYLEKNIRALVQLRGVPAKISGKMDLKIPENYELAPESVAKVLAEASGLPTENPMRGSDIKEIFVPPRPPVLCPGCPHRATYYAVKRAVTMAGIKDPIFSSDIGCYSLGFYEPFQEADVLLSMGSSIGTASGFSIATGQKVIAFIGDSTFYHAGIPPLINAYHNGSSMLLMILDNGITAMTGGQPNPGEADGPNGRPLNIVPIENIVRGIGIDFIRIVDPYDLKATLRAVSEGLRHDGIAVIIARRECAILRDRRMKSEGKIVKFQVDPAKCSLCRNCIEKFACPALHEEDKVVIDQELCDGCGVCAEPYVCPFGAIKIMPGDQQ
ncbi:MAG: indolepyruvate ferredoxin oxidoreductase subunit alpha [Thermoplasmataceae archaeon]